MKRLLDLIKVSAFLPRSKTPFKNFDIIIGDPWLRRRGAEVQLKALQKEHSEDDLEIVPIKIGLLDFLRFRKMICW